MDSHGAKRPNKEEADAVWRDIADGLSDEDLLKAAPEGWTPTSQQMAYARSYVSARPLATIGAIAAGAGVDRASVSRWRHGGRFREWMASVLVGAAGVATDHVWRACHYKAMKGDAGCIRMWVRRFDPVYANMESKSEAKRPDAAGVPDDVAAAADASLAGQEQTPEPGGGGETGCEV